MMPTPRLTGSRRRRCAGDERKVTAGCSQECCCYGDRMLCRDVYTSASQTWVDERRLRLPVKRIVFILLLLFPHFAYAQTSVLQGKEGRSINIEQIEFGDDGKVTVDGKQFSSGNVYQWISGNPSTVGANHAVRLHDGQQYLGAITSADKSNVTLRAEPWNQEITFPVDRVAELVFLRRSKSPRVQREGGVLYRPEATPVPCQLDSIKDKQIVVSSRIGRFRLSIASLSRYVFASEDSVTQPNADWEVGLTDGSVLHGNLISKDHKLELTVPERPSLLLPKSTVRYVRNLKATQWLPLWLSGQVIEDGIGKDQPTTWGQAITISIGESINLPTPVKSGTLQFVAANQLNETEQNGSLKIVLSNGQQEMKSFEIESAAPKTYSAKISDCNSLTIRLVDDENNESETPASLLIADISIVAGKAADK